MELDGGSDKTKVNTGDSTLAPTVESSRSPSSHAKHSDPDALAPLPAVEENLSGARKSPDTDATGPSALAEQASREAESKTVDVPAAAMPSWEAAKAQVTNDMAMPDMAETPDRTATLPKRGRPRGRPPKRANFSAVEGHGDADKMAADTPSTTPGSSGRGRGGGRPRGRGRGGSGRGGKRKRDEGDDGGDSDSSEEITTPLNTMTKSGRAVQKPTTFVPPTLPSPVVSGIKRKRTYRRNPESAVCKVCLRGASPATNMIVFCDGCNTPFHRYCHHPPIDQSVIDQVDKEWYCQACETERAVVVAESFVVNLVSAPQASAERRQQYFASLPSGMLVTLLTKATTLYPDCPVFSSAFQAATSTMPPPSTPQPPVNGHGHPPRSAAQAASEVTARPSSTTAATATSSLQPNPAVNATEEDEGNISYIDHPSTFPRPGHGLTNQLPPEHQDLQWLVEDDTKSETFHHVYRVDAEAAHSGLNGKVA